LRLAAVGGCWKTQKDISICNSNIYNDKRHELYYSRRLILYHASYRQRFAATRLLRLLERVFSVTKKRIYEIKRSVSEKLSNGA
jgi:hypothetical protein